MLGFCLGGKLAYLAACRTDADVAVGYYGVGIEAALDEADKIKRPLVLHIAELDKFCPPEARDKIVKALQGRPNVTLYVYPGVDHAFARTGGDHYRQALGADGAPAQHRRAEGGDRPALRPVGAVGQALRVRVRHAQRRRDDGDDGGRALRQPHPDDDRRRRLQGAARASTRNHFVNSNPPDTKLTPISRTVGATQVVDEMLFSFTHTTEIPWMLPGIAPTGKRVEVPLLAVVKFRGDKLYHEHIYWDQASVLVQIGLLDPTRLPVAGVETARKLLDETLPSNTLMPDWAKSAPG